MNNPVKKKQLKRDIQAKVDFHRKVKPKEIIDEALQSSYSERRIQSGLATYTGTWSELEVAHLLKRVSIGAKKEDLRNFVNVGLTQSIASVLLPQEPAAPPINNYHYPEEDIVDPDVAPGETWVNAPYNNEYEGYRILSLKGWFIQQLVDQPASIHQKMVLFWHNLLVTQFWDVFVGKSSYQYLRTLQAGALGNFKQLIKSITIDPSMLIYLNGTFNNKEAPDENFARELQELFCIGKGPDAQFTEVDVRAASKVLTGWVIDWDSFIGEGEVKSFFHPPYHDVSDKTFSQFYDDQVISGRTGVEGEQELDKLLDMIFNNQETALYICRRLYQFFVYSEIDDQTELKVIVPLAQIFRDSNYEIAPVLSALFSSEHFFDELNIGAMIKNPVDHLIGLWRTLDVQDIQESESFARLQQYQSMLWTMADQGMELGDPTSVSGWPAYYQAPQYDKYWITTDTVLSRASTTDAFVYWGFWVNQEKKVTIDLIRVLNMLDQPEEPNAMIRELGELLLGLPLSEVGISQLKQILLSGQNQDYYWTNAWMQLQNNPNDSEVETVVLNRLKPMFQHLFQLGECHLM